jgi:serine/threonine-protein kinase
MPPLAARALRVLGVLAYAALAVVVFVVAGYLSFSAFVRSGTTPAPDLAGLTRQQAAERLADSGLRLRVDEGTGRWDAEVPAGSVLEQHPGARTLVKRGSEVGVALSLGPQKLAVPDLAGQSLQSAQIRLAAAGLTLGRTLAVFRPGADAGAVVGQAPAAGTTVSPGAAVDAVLALAGSGPVYVMPDLVYRDYERVRGFFELRGFRLGGVKFEPYEGVAAGTVLRQFPLAGHPLTRRDAISLVVVAAEQSAPPP